jgi:hypothetical protein
LASPASYRWLQTIRDFAMEKLAQSSEAGVIHDRHLDFYLALAEEAKARLLGPAQGDWYKRLDGELENLLAAHAWCANAADSAQKGLRLVTAIRTYWVNRGLFELGARVLDEALGRADAKASTLERGHALFAAHMKIEDVCERKDNQARSGPADDRCQRAASHPSVLFIMILRRFIGNILALVMTSRLYANY